MSIGSRQHTEFLLDFNCELNKKSRDDWKLLSSDHRHDARRSSQKVSFSPKEKTIESARMGFRIIMKLSVARTLSFYISNNGEKDECLYLTLRRYG